MGGKDLGGNEIGSPRGTHFRNGFGESGFEITLDVTNRVALLPSGQPVGFSFQRPDSDLAVSILDPRAGAIQFTGARFPFAGPSRLSPAHPHRVPAVVGP